MEFQMNFKVFLFFKRPSALCTFKSLRQKCILQMSFTMQVKTKLGCKFFLANIAVLSFQSPHCVRDTLCTQTLNFTNIPARKTVLCL